MLGGAGRSLEKIRGSKRCWEVVKGAVKCCEVPGGVTRSWLLEGEGLGMIWEALGEAGGVRRD